MCNCFFFQAEDGIRDLVRSRGLGDVYKRQLLLQLSCFGVAGFAEAAGKQVEELHVLAAALGNPVSYTHLTLPTSDLV